MHIAFNTKRNRFQSQGPFFAHFCLRYGSWRKDWKGI